RLTPGDFIPEWWAISSRNGGRFQIGMVGDFISESWAISSGISRCANDLFEIVRLRLCHGVRVISIPSFCCLLASPFGATDQTRKVGNDLLEALILDLILEQPETVITA
ncbi:hypothetical protein, partial [Bradyrhizobium zhanjiangense]|uniref:hypothetical protein n=1 Tax=Bradyrhizobium zhanjiangense TaxID=1325107 RepID=UPI0019D718A0